MGYQRSLPLPATSALLQQTPHPTWHQRAEGQETQQRVWNVPRLRAREGSRGFIPLIQAALPPSSHPHCRRPTPSLICTGWGWARRTSGNESVLCCSPRAQSLLIFPVPLPQHAKRAAAPKSLKGSPCWLVLSLKSAPRTPLFPYLPSFVSLSLLPLGASRKWEMAVQGSGVSKTHPRTAWKTPTVCHFIKSKEIAPVYENLRNTGIERKETGSSRSHWPWKRTCCVWFSLWGLLVHIYKCPPSKAEFLNTQNSQPFTLVLLGPSVPSIPSSEQSRPSAPPNSVQAGSEPLKVRG